MFTVPNLFGAWQRAPYDDDEDPNDDNGGMMMDHHRRMATPPPCWWWQPQWQWPPPPASMTGLVLAHVLVTLINLLHYVPFYLMDAVVKQHKLVSQYFNGQ